MYERRRKEFISAPQPPSTEKLSSRLYADIVSINDLVEHLQNDGLYERAAEARALQRRLWENHRIARYNEMKSSIDSLTTLYNREAFEKVFKEKIATVVDKRQKGDLNAALYVLRIDLDKFKAINDRISHEAGDIYLESIATEMAVGLREDDFIGRLGGDEFGILISTSDERFKAAVVGERLVEAVKQGSLKAKWHPKLTAIHHTLEVTASVGVDAFNGTEDPDKFFDRVDALCYTAKDAGGDAHVDRELARELNSKRLSSRTDN